MGILGNASGGFGYPKSFVITDDSGNELTAVVTDEEMVVFDATPADVRINKKFASENGIQTGENTITYRTIKGRELVPAGQTLSIMLDEHNMYNFTKIQCMIAPFNTNVKNSVAIDKVVIDDCVYNVGSTEKLSDVTKNSTTLSIDLNITNNTDDYCVIHYFTYREEE